MSKCIRSHESADRGCLPATAADRGRLPSIAAGGGPGPAGDRIRDSALAAWRLADPRAKADAALALARRVGSMPASRAALRPLQADTPTAGDTGPGLAAPGLVCLGLASPEMDSPEPGTTSPARRPPWRAPVCAAPEPLALERPGRPAAPKLVEPRSLPQRPAATAEGRAALLHAIAHIELNAIDLALDAAWRFAAMPAAFCVDWIGVAAEEAMHFGMIADELAARGFAYGDFDAHDGLWRMAELTRDDALDRMAMVPGVMEARGLDATPPIQARLAQAGDARAVELLQVILDDEVGHVALGRRWFAWLCAQDAMEPAATFASIARRCRAPRPRAPNLEARRRAGYSEQELAWLTAALAAAEG